MHCSAGRFSIVRSFFHAFVLDKSCGNNFSWCLVLSVGNGDYLCADDDFEEMAFQMRVSDGATHIVLRCEVDLLLLALQFVAASSVRPSRALSPPRTSAESLPVFFFLPFKSRLFLSSSLRCLEVEVCLGVFVGIPGSCMLIYAAAVCWYAGFLQLWCPAACSLHYPELSPLH